MSDDVLEPLRMLVTRLREEIATLATDNKYLRTENESLWETIDELRALNERAREDA